MMDIMLKWPLLGQFLNYLKENNLDYFTYNKSLQKICESLKVSKEEKNIIRGMKVKLNNN